MATPQLKLIVADNNFQLLKNNSEFAKRSIVDGLYRNFGSSTASTATAAEELEEEQIFINFWDCVKDGTSQATLQNLELFVGPNGLLPTHPELNSNAKETEYENYVIDKMKQQLESYSWTKIKKKNKRQRSGRPNVENPNLVFDKVLWESGLSPALFTCGRTLQLSELVTTLGSFFDPLSKEAGEFYGNATHYPTNNLSIDKTAMKIFGFGRSEITSSYYVNGKWNYDLTVGCGQECNSDNPPPGCNDNQDSKFETYSQTGNKMKKQKLSLSSTSIIKKIKYIVGKEWGDKLQVIIYFMMILYDESVVMATGDMVVFTLCLVLKIPCFYTSVKQNKIDSLFPQEDPKNITRIIYYAGEGGEIKRYIKSAEKTIKDIQENNARIIDEYETMTKFAKGLIRIKTGTSQGDNPGQSGIHIDYDIVGDSTLGKLLFEHMLTDVKNINLKFNKYWKPEIELMINTDTTMSTDDQLFVDFKELLQEADKYTLKSIFTSFDKKIINRVSSYTENEDDTSKPNVANLVSSLSDSFNSFESELGQTKINSLKKPDFHKKKFYHIITTLLCESNSTRLQVNALVLSDAEAQEQQNEDDELPDAVEQAPQEQQNEGDELPDAKAQSPEQQYEDDELPDAEAQSPEQQYEDEDDEDTLIVPPEYIKRETSYIKGKREDDEEILPQADALNSTLSATQPADAIEEETSPETKFSYSNNERDIIDNDDSDYDVIDSILIEDTEPSIIKTTTLLKKENGEIKVLTDEEIREPQIGGGKKRKSEDISTSRNLDYTEYLCYVNLDRVLISGIYNVLIKYTTEPITIKILRDAINLYYNDSDTNNRNIMPGIPILQDDDSVREYNENFDKYIQGLLEPEQNAMKIDKDVGSANRENIKTVRRDRDSSPERSGNGKKKKFKPDPNDSINRRLSYNGGAIKTRKKSKSKSSQLRKTIKKRILKKIKRKSLRRRKPIKKRVNSKNRKVKRKIKNKTRKYKKPKKQKRSRKPKPKS
jgi:hypothetical protein